MPLFLKAIGHPEAAKDPRFADSRDRHAHAIDITALLDEEFATRSLADWRKILDDVGLTYGVAQTLEEAAHDPQLVADQVVVPVDGGAPRPYRTINSPVRLDQEQKVPPGPAPRLGEHTQAVLSELGFDADAIERLGSVGAIPDRGHQTSKP